MVVWGLLGEGSMMARRMRAFVVANEMGRGGSCFRQFIGGLVAWYALVTLPLANRLGVMCAALNSLK